MIEGTLMPVAPSLGSVDISQVMASRVVDFSPYGPDETAHIGAGLTAESFTNGVGKPMGIGHIGLLESCELVADALGLEVDRWEQTEAPVIAERPHHTAFITIPPGMVRGFRQRVPGWSIGELAVDFEMVGLLDPDDADPGLHTVLTMPLARSRGTLRLRG